MRREQGLSALLSQFVSGEEGQATLEYILILSACVLGATQLGRKILSVLDGGILRVGAELEKDLKTGRAPLDVWTN